MAEENNRIEILREYAAFDSSGAIYHSAIKLPTMTTSNTKSFLFLRQRNKERKLAISCEIACCWSVDNLTHSRNVSEKMAKLQAIDQFQV